MEEYVPQTVAELMQSWLQAKRMKLKQTSYATYRNAVDAYILPLIGDRRLDKINRDELQSFVRRLYSRGLSEKSVWDINTKLNAALQWAAERRYIEHAGFCVKIHMNQRESMRILTEEEKRSLESFLIHSEQERNEKIGILLCMQCGIKVGELSALCYGDFDLDKGVICVNKRLQRLASLNANGKKTEVSIFPVDERRIPITPQLAKLVEAAGAMDGGAFFLTGTITKYMEPRTLQMRLKTYLKICGLDETIGFNELRATYISSTLDSGVNICDVGKLVGAKRLSHIGEKYRAYSFDRADPVNRPLHASPESAL